jgi:branched-chain amino acid transport system substrate-binding protein
MRARGYTVVDTGRFQPGNDDFSAQIRAFKQAGAQILTGVLPPPAFQTFWTQAAQQEFRPRIATVAKALLFPAVAASLGARGHGLTTEVWWSPYHPFRSSLGGLSAAQYSAEYARSSGRSWTQPMGFRHALFEVAADVMARAASIDDPRAIRAAIASTTMDTLVGRVDFTHGPVPNIATTPLVGGQWQAAAGGGVTLQVVDDTRAAVIPVTAPLQVLPDAR